MSAKQNSRDEQTPKTGKVANDHNKTGEQEVTQKNEAKRTPDSRTDREAHLAVATRRSPGAGTRPAENHHAREIRPLRQKAGCADGRRSRVFFTTPDGANKITSSALAAGACERFSR